MKMPAEKLTGIFRSIQPRHVIWAYRQEFPRQRAQSKSSVEKVIA
jgi:hypothetical protein